MNFSLPCRTCLEDAEVYVNITEKCHLNNSVKDVIIMLVPQMADTLCDVDSVCGNCYNTLSGCMNFIEKCIEVEAKIKREQSEGISELDYPVVLVPPFEKSNVEIVNGNTSLDIKGGSTEEYSDTSGHNEEEHSYSKSEVKIKPLDPIMHAFPEHVKEHNRILSLQQPDGVVIQNFVLDLLQSGINVLQISKDPKPITSCTDYSYKDSTNKRILLLGSHIPNMKYKCPNCPKHLQNEKKYTSHVSNCKKIPKKKEKNELMKCPFCDKSIRSKQMEAHLQRHEERQRKLESASNLTKIRKPYKKRVLRCRTCFEKFATTEEYEFHLEIHPPYICDQCGRGFVQYSSFISHQKTHNDPNSFICEVCGKGYKDAGMLRVHRQTHEDTKFKCHMCSKVFKLKLRLTRHIKSVHSTGGTDQCSQCGKVFKNRSSHNAHFRLVHLKMKPYKCEICGKKFGRCDYLRRHRTTHTGQPFKSDQIRSAKKGKYTSEPTLPCKFCGKRLHNKTKLKLHLGTHIKIRRFPCQFCPLTFAHRENRRRHELLHKGFENFFRCNICWRKLSSKEDLDAHIKAKHRNPRHPCNVCGKMFHRAYLLNHHNLLEHRTPEDIEKAKQIVHESLLEIAAAESEV